MGRFYKTHSAPIVDYGYEYPFDELFKAGKYKNELQDSRLTKMENAYDDILNINFVPGGGDEQYVKDKRTQINDLVNKYSTTDLTGSAWGEINRQINTIAKDPNLADIQTTYNNYLKEQANVAALQKAGKYRPSDAAPTAIGWDTRDKGIYSGLTPGYTDFKPSLKKMFDDLKGSAVATSDGSIAYVITPEDVQGVADTQDEQWTLTAEGQQAINDFKIMYPEEAANKTDRQISNMIINDWGQKLIGNDLTGGGGFRGSGSGSSDTKLGTNTGTAWALNSRGVTPLQYNPALYGNSLDKSGTLFPLVGSERITSNPVTVNNDPNAAEEAHRLDIYKRYKKQTEPISNNLQAAQATLASLKADLDKGKGTTKSMGATWHTTYSPYEGEELAQKQTAIKEQEAKVLELQNNINAISDAMWDKYRVNVDDPSLAETYKNWKPKGQYTSEELKNMSNAEQRALIKLDLVDLINETGGAAVWQAIPNAPTKDMQIGVDSQGRPIMGKQIQGNIVIEKSVLEKVLIDRGYGDEGNWFGDVGAPDWDRKLVGPNNLFQEFNPMGTGLPTDKEYMIMRGAWRQVEDNFAVADQINQIAGVNYGTGAKGIEAQEEQERLYNQGRIIQQNEAIEKINIENEGRNKYRTAVQLFNPQSGHRNPDGSSKLLDTVETNTKDLVQSLIDSDDAKQIDVAERLVNYLDDLGAWKDGKMVKHKLKGTDFRNTDPKILEIAEISDLLLNNDIKAIEELLATKENKAGTYNGQRYISEDGTKLIKGKEEIYKTAAKNRAETLGLVPIDLRQFLNLKIDKEAYAPYLTTKATNVLRSLDGMMSSLGGITLHGAYRTPEYNKVVEGSATSLHMSGNAIDLAPNPQLINRLYKDPGLRQVKDVKYKGKQMKKFIFDKFSVLDEGHHLHIEVF